MSKLDPKDLVNVDFKFFIEIEFDKGFWSIVSYDSFNVNEKTVIAEYPDSKNFNVRGKFNVVLASMPLDLWYIQIVDLSLGLGRKAQLIFKHDLTDMGNDAKLN